jgi:hypothetical protein
MSCADLHNDKYANYASLFSAPNPTKRKGGPGGLNKVCGVSPELQAIVGQPTMARTEVPHIPLSPSSAIPQCTSVVPV